MELFQRLREHARVNPKRIVLPESSDNRILHAANSIIEDGLASLVLLGQEDDVFKRAKELGLKNLKDIEIINPLKSKHLKQFIDIYYKLRSHKGMTIKEARGALTNPLYFAALMVRENLVDGFVAGASITSSEVAKAAIQAVGVDKKIQTVSSSFLMVVPECEFGEEGIFMFADCGIVPRPSAKQIANIATSTAYLFKQLIGAEPKVAMLSYSSYGSGGGESVEKMKKATELVKELSPALLIDGELQVDAAIVPKVANIKVPGSILSGKANVLIFPNLATGNICYKLVQRLSGARAVGPMLQGLIRPCSDLSRGCSVEDIIDAVTINVVRAQ